MQTTVVEPLAELAWLAWRRADDACVNEHGCRDYHRAWSLVRLLSENGSELAGEDFFQQEFKRIQQHQPIKRVLISGGADTGLTTLAINACLAAGARADFVFVDRCATPCEQNQLLAKATQTTIDVIKEDIVDVEIEPVDVVIAHNFLPFFDQTGRSLVLQSWRRNCNVGGTLLLSNTLVAEESDWEITRDEQAMNGRALRLREKALAAGQSRNVADAIYEAALALWRLQPLVLPAITERSMRKLIEAAGFDVQAIEQRDFGSMNRPMGGLGVKNTSRIRAGIRAVRRC